MKEKRTINEVFRSFTNRISMPEDKGIVVRDFMNGKGLPAHIANHYHSLDIVPSGLELDNTEIELTSSYMGDGANSEWNKRTLICRWIEESGSDENYDYIIFDCPPATKIVSQNAIAASHGYIIPVIPEAVMQFGVPHLIDLIKYGIDERLKRYSDEAINEKRISYVPETTFIGVAITRIQSSRGRNHNTNDANANLSSLSRQLRQIDIASTELLEPYISQGVGVPESLRAGLPVYDTTHFPNVRRQKARGGNFPEQFQSLVADLKIRIDEL